MVWRMKLHRRPPDSTNLSRSTYISSLAVFFFGKHWKNGSNELPDGEELRQSMTILESLEQRTTDPFLSGSCWDLFNMCKHIRSWLFLYKTTGHYIGFSSIFSHILNSAFLLFSYTHYYTYIFILCCFLSVVLRSLFVLLLYMCLVLLNKTKITFTNYNKTYSLILA